MSDRGSTLLDPRSRSVPTMGAGVCTSWLCDAMGLGMSVLQLGQFVPQHVEMVRFGGEHASAVWWTVWETGSGGCGLDQWPTWGLGCGQGAGVWCLRLLSMESCLF